MRFLEPFTPEQRALIRSSVQTHGGPSGLVELESHGRPEPGYAERVIDLLGNDVQVRPDGTPEGNADEIRAVIEAITEYWT
ncbi:hypothetical protein [Gordonia soli]|uniref:Uncharacterized protein n=1 Tax=Gordonia soli NBRC 108243 TaxID=1223545 RepID=M0QIW4_9ACTN|nr:hypothetical protein [Gordonia soli]GAC68575.1 hypothetical protein GS4_16_01050 [Gordonia soli NBRC 108243]